MGGEGLVKPLNFSVKSMVFELVIAENIALLSESNSRGTQQRLEEPAGALMARVWQHSELAPECAPIQDGDYRSTETLNCGQMPSPTRRSPSKDRRSVMSVRQRLADWLVAHGRRDVVIVDHAEIDGFDFGVPLIDTEARGCLPAPMRRRLASVVAVERSVYTGLRSVYAIRRSDDLVALLSGLAHGFTPATLRLERDSLQRFVESDAWRLAGCEYCEPRSGSWHRPPNTLRAALDGKSDTRSKWNAQLFAPCRSTFGGFAPYRLTLVRDNGTKVTRAGVPKIEIASAPQARDAAAVIARALGIPVPSVGRKSTGAISPALIWPPKPRAAKIALTRTQWARAY